MNPMDMFFSLGDKVTRGDVKRKADFDYYLFWIMFMAFFIVFLDNILRFFFYDGTWTNLGWGLVMVAILWFQYHGLKQMYEFRKIINKPVEKELPPEEMVKEFK